ncbi:MAG: hypothetical protein M9920_02140 [Verrucomicrobiae bacterium]|nr:hypothetical protein [Verrucomicrobiae bacterium]
MRVFVHPQSTVRRAKQRGVALVVTIVLLSIITFLAVVFLALTGRESGAVKVSVNQSAARQAAEAGFERAKAQLLARILATTNASDFGLLVSTNFINRSGFDSAAVNQLTNVNYDYQDNGNPLTAAQFLRNLTNLLYDPRPPVYVTNRAFANSNEFRYYVDLDRNGRPDWTGYQPLTNALGQAVVSATNASVLETNYVVGDPEWIGIMDRVNLSHGPDNPFLSRYAFLAQPIGNTLDLNYAHNNSKRLPQNGFFRNQGVGTWELNFAAFLRDLNTNYWTYNLYSTNTPGGVSVGTAFDDAWSLWNWRMGSAGQASVQGLFGINGVNALTTDFSDAYGAGPLLAYPFGSGYTQDPDQANATMSTPWPGADFENHFYSPQDLFDPAKARSGMPYGLPDRLAAAGTNVSTYDRNTYYRLLEQLGTDSAPEDAEKLNLNYVNIGGLSATNFIAWTDTARLQAHFGATVNPALLFFTNAVDRLLRTYSTEWLASDYAVYTNLFRIDYAFGVTNIPVVISNQFVYSPAVHRLLQLAANLWDTKPNPRALQGFPTIFRPLFQADPVGTNVYISGFVELDNARELNGLPLLDIMATNNPATAIGNGNVMIFGAPPVVGVHKGLPNFNEFSAAPTLTMTRKLKVRKNTAGNLVSTNQFFTMSVIMPSGAEFWNSYASNYTRPVNIFVTNRATVTITNDLGLRYSPPAFVTSGFYSTNNWSRHMPDSKRPFIVPMSTNVPFLPVVGYVTLPAYRTGFVMATNTAVYDPDPSFPMPRWGVTISNRVHAMILEAGTDRIIDYVLLGNMVFQTNWTDMICTSEAGTGDPLKLLWATNTLSGPYLSGQVGVLQQINISQGMPRIPDDSEGWASYRKGNPDDVSSAIRNFSNFLSKRPINNLAADELEADAPFTPTAQFYVPMIYEANDPLVHYLSDDLFDLQRSGFAQPVTSLNPSGAPPGNAGTIGDPNARYHPWASDPAIAASDPDAYNPALKDPMVTASDSWDFPTNALPTIGWLGRVHRGTPWQSVYLKAFDIGLAGIASSPTEWAHNSAFQKAAQKWANWAGSRTLEGGFYNRPVTDRLLFDVFTTALNDNASRGRLSVNQSGLAAWSAVFSGVTVLTNSIENRPSSRMKYDLQVIQPAGIYDAQATNLWPPLVRLVDGINRTRWNTNYFRGGTFEHLGDILAVPELTDASPFLNLKAGSAGLQKGINDAAYEWLPQQVMSLLQLGTPRFVIYAYGQALQPAPDSILAGGAYSGLCTNYAITAEQAIRAVVRVEGSPDPRNTSTNLPVARRYPPRIIVESFNPLGPE